LISFSAFCSVDHERNIDKDTVVEVGKGNSPSFPEVLKLLLAEGDFLAFAPDTDETNNMIDILSLKFPELRVIIITSSSYAAF
jgi:ATP-binding cassette subfamily A (ABC1) protein 3